MEMQEVIERIQNAIPDAQIDVEGADCTFTARVIAAQFAEQKPVQRQQRVLACFSDCLGDGRLHALTVLAYTPDEFANKSQPGHLTQLTL